MLVRGGRRSGTEVLDHAVCHEQSQSRVQSGVAGSGDGRHLERVAEGEGRVGYRRKPQPKPVDDLGLVGGVLAWHPEDTFRPDRVQDGEVITEIARLGRAAAAPGMASHPFGRSTPDRPVRSAGRSPSTLVTDPFLPKIEEWVEVSKGRIRADKALEKLVRSAERALIGQGDARSPRCVPRGGLGMFGCTGRGSPGLPLVAIRLRRRAGHRRTQDRVVHRVVGMGTVPGRDRPAGPDGAVGVCGVGSHVPDHRRRARRAACFMAPLTLEGVCRLISLLSPFGHHGC